MAVIAHLELRLNPDKLDVAHQIITDTLVATRAFDGNLGVEVLVDAADPAHVVAVETWESLEHDAAYRAFRATDAGKSDLGTVLAAPPVLTLWELDPNI